MLLNAAVLSEFRRAIRQSKNETAEPYPNKPSVVLKIAVAIGGGAQGCAPHRDATWAHVPFTNL